MTKQYKRTKRIKRNSEKDHISAGSSQGPFAFGAEVSGLGALRCASPVAQRDGWGGDGSSLEAAEEAAAAEAATAAAGTELFPSLLADWISVSLGCGEFWTYHGRCQRHWQNTKATRKKDLPDCLLCRAVARVAEKNTKSLL